jgi:hypothetical protein
VDFVFGLVSALPGWLFPAAVAAFVVLRLVLHLRSWLGRTVAWEKMAAELGLHYRSDVSDLASHFPQFDMLAAGHGTRWLNVLQGESSGTSVCFADRCGSRAANRTLCILQSSDLHLPRFSVRRQRHPLGRLAFLYRQAIGIEDHPASPQSARVRGDIDIEAGDDTVVVSYGRLIDPATAPALLADARDVLASLLSRNS